MAAVKLDRRTALGGGALLAIALGVPVVADRLLRAPGPHATPEQVQLINDVAQITLPRTKTPGAGDAEVGEFVALALAHGLDGTRAPAAGSAMPATLERHTRSDGTLDYLDWLDWRLNSGIFSAYLSRSVEERTAAVAAIDDEAFAEGAEGSPWIKLKGLILTGYYTSQIGATQELQYELVPGRFDPDLPYVPGTPAWSSDWTAVEFS